MGKFHWGKAEWIRNYWKNCPSFPEPFSLRQVFYKEIPQIEEFVPDYVKEEHPNWANTFYQNMTNVLSKCFRYRKISNVTGKPISYRDLNIYDASGALKAIWTGKKMTPVDIIGEAQTEYPIEVWVENDATFTSIAPLLDFNNGEFCLNLVSCKGWGKAQHVEALMLDRAETRIILYLTDFDPDGYYMTYKDFSISKAIRLLGLDVQVVRIGILPEQIPEERRRTSIHSFKMGTRGNRFLQEFGEKYPIVLNSKGYELQALSPPELRDLVRKSLLNTIEEHDFERRDRRELIQED